MVSFELVMIGGVYPASNVLFVILLVIIFVPIIIYHLYKEYRKRGEHERKSKVLFSNLISAPYNPEIIKSAECNICLLEFDPNSS